MLIELAFRPIRSISHYVRLWFNVSIGPLDWDHDPHGLERTTKIAKLGNTISATKTMGDSNFSNRPALGQLNLIE